MVNKWTPESDLKLLVAAIKYLDATLPPVFFEGVAPKLDGDFSAGAVKFVPRVPSPSL